MAMTERHIASKVATPPHSKPRYEGSGAHRIKPLLITLSPTNGQVVYVIAYKTAGRKAGEV
jgi:hypothetical protein